MDEQSFLDRYSRQMLLHEVQRAGQSDIASSVVVVIGAGGLGATCLPYLAGAGVGTLRIVDFDVVESTNLHRQVLHSTEGAAKRTLKVHSAVDRLIALNPNVCYEPIAARITHDNAWDIVKDAHVVVDCSDNFATRYLLCDICYILNINLVSGSAIGFEGQMTVFVPTKSACYRCIYPAPSFAENCRSCSNAGVFGPVPGVIGCMQASETLKVLLARSEQHRNERLQLLSGKQIYYNASTGQTSQFILQSADPECKLCGGSASIHSIEDSKADIEDMFATMTCATPEQPILSSSSRMSVSELAEALITKKIILLDVRSEAQYSMTRLESFRGYQTNIVHIPLKALLKMKKIQIQEILISAVDFMLDSELNAEICTICRRGIDSVSAAKFLLDNGFGNTKNVDGGLTAWKDEIERSFLFY